MIIFYVIILLALSVYSYALIDPNITFVNHPLWSKFMEQMLQLGYYHRDISWYIYLSLVVLLVIFHQLFKRHYKKHNPLKLAVVIGSVLLISYPFLSHDFFNYMFDAKILTFYGKNPYMFKALDFPDDQWLRFMHWTHRSYPYGPVFLLITLVPSFLSFGKFFIGFLLFKITTILFYLAAVWFLTKKDKYSAMVFATHPLILIEGLVNGHNDLIAASLGIIGIYIFFKSKHRFSRIILLLSPGIKYITLPVIAVSKNSVINIIALLTQVLILVYLSISSEIQPWYFMALFVFLPFYRRFITGLNIFLFGLLLSYYPYIRLGGWDSVEKVNLKHWIILVFLAFNAGIFIVSFFKTRIPLNIKQSSRH